MSTQTGRYKAQAFQPRNLVLFFLIALGLHWLWAALVFFGILKQPSGFTDPTILLVGLAGWSPTIAAFLVTAITEGKPGVSALWKRFWNRNVSLKLALSGGPGGRGSLDRDHLRPQEPGAAAGCGGA